MTNRIIFLTVFLGMITSCGGQKAFKGTISRGMKELERKNIESLGFLDCDSFFFYKDLNLSTLKGVEKLDSNSISYPFVVVGYKKDTILIASCFKEDSIVKWVLKRGANFWFVEFKNIDTRTKEKVFSTLIFTDDYRFITISTIEKRIDFKAGVLKPDLLIYADDYAAKSLTTKNYHSFQVNDLLSLDDILKYNKPKLDSSFYYYFERTELIKDNKLYLDKELERDHQSGKIFRTRKKSFLLIEKFMYPTFFYYLSQDQVRYSNSLN